MWIWILSLFLRENNFSSFFLFQKLCTLVLKQVSQGKTKIAPFPPRKWKTDILFLWLRLYHLQIRGTQFPHDTDLRCGQRAIVFFQKKHLEIFWETRREIFGFWKKTAESLGRYLRWIPGVQEGRTHRKGRHQIQVPASSSEVAEIQEKSYSWSTGGVCLRPG